MSAESRRRSDPLEQGLDRLVSAGRQLVDGVAGARPGSRPAARGADRRSGSLPRLEGLGRWVEDKLDRILDDEDDWREPWQEPQPESRQGDPPGRRHAEAAPEPRRRRPLDAISRRSRTLPVPPEPEPPAPPPRVLGGDGPGGDWPDDDAFTLQRWQRPAQPERPPLQPGEAVAPLESADLPRSSSRPVGRPLPRSSRRRGA
ncbi:MAG: hypothetical protein VKM97_01280 [Cyanobacteriota bacterium]|nr:hypothetical protein [Cyanobacteriota bacterium]